MITIKKNTYGGFDWHDACTRTEFLMNGKSFDFSSKENAQKAVIENIISEYPYAEQDIRKAFETGEELEFPAKVPVYDDNNAITGYEDCATDIFDGKVYHELHVYINPKELSFTSDYLYGQVSYNTHYYIEEVQNPSYMVIENFLAVTKGVPSVERTYHEPFKELSEAKAYKESLKPHDKYSSEVYIACVDIDKINEVWLDNQRKAFNFFKERPEYLYDETFSPWAEHHYENIVNAEIKRIEDAIEYENKKLNHCAYERSDLMYIEALKSRLEELENIEF